jgi:hypothetical protein
MCCCSYVLRSQIFGSILCGVGAYAMQTKAGGLAGETLPSGIIVLGVFIILVSFVGCFAAYRESRLFLAVYFGFLLIFVIILMAVGIAVYAQKDSADKYMSQGWCKAQQYNDLAVIRDIQNYFQCCGLNFYNDSQGFTDNTVDSKATTYPGCYAYRDPSDQNYAYISCPTGLDKTTGLACLPILSSTFVSSYIAAGACAIAFAVIMSAGMVVVCVLMSGIKEKRHLEDIRKLHRKLREAKEDPTHAGLRGMEMSGAEGGGDAGGGYGDVDLNAEPLDTDVQLNVDDGTGVGGNYAEEAAVASFTPGQSTFKAQPPVKIKKSKSPKVVQPPPEEEVEEQPYEEESYESQGRAKYQPQADEYDDEDE